MGLRPLDGFVVAVTADRRWQDQAELLSRRGASVLHGPTITTDYLADDDRLRSATLDLVADPPDYLVATTGIGLRAWLEAAATWGLAGALVTALAGARLVARGPKAAAVLTAAGLEVWARSPDEQLASVAGVLAGQDLAGRRVAVQEYGVASPGFTAALEAAGAAVVAVAVYRWRLPDCPTPARRLIAAAIAGRVDAVTFTAAPAVRNLFVLAEEAGVARQLRAALNGRVTVACVGPVCAAAAREEGLEAPVAPVVGRLGLLVRALEDHLGTRRRTVRLGGTTVVVQGSAVEIGGEPVTLAAKERGVFEQLAAAPGRVVARADLLDRVWGSPVADARALEAAVTRLRRRLGPGGAALQAVPGRGYQLDPDALG